MVCKWFARDDCHYQRFILLKAPFTGLILRFTQLEIVKPLSLHYLCTIKKMSIVQYLQ
jgi:hypothetical protein